MTARSRGSTTGSPRPCARRCRCRIRRSWSGGGGERKTLRLVAQYADACNLFAATPDELSHKLDVLRGHCLAVGRDPGEIRVTILNGGARLLDGDVPGFVDEMRPFAAQGVDTVILRPPATPLAGWVRDVVAPAVAPLAEL